jgi:hypothetical protein
VQFVKGGPDIDERLLQAHEDGRVVFFCGAGISYPAGLPGFSGLTGRLYADLFIDPSAIEVAALKSSAFDTAIGLVENRLPGGRPQLRQAMATILTPDLTRPGAAKTHESLLHLGTARDGRCRLVTTNFDRLFENERVRLGVANYQAPLLPIPKSRWAGVVYLHGLLSDNPTDDELNRLVVSSGDFGLAYLTERWAARFVSELFRTYTICFVGYSLNDPVLRYMMDALAADRLLGEQPREAFAFGSFAKGKYEAAANEWKAKNVTPILYANHRRHAYLHRTLQAWAETYRDGVRGKIAIVTKYGLTRPMGSTRQDDYVGRMLWALGDPSGDPAQRFSELNPLPSLEWLEPLSEARFGHDDLPRFGISPAQKPDRDLAFSLISRPTPYNRSSWMSLVSARGPLENRWDGAMARLAVWLVRHINDPKLLLWTVEKGGPVGVFRILLERRMKTEPPGGGLGVLWHLMLHDRVHRRGTGTDLYQWRSQFATFGLTPALRWELLQLLTPMVHLAEPYGLGDQRDRDEGRAVRVNELVHWEIVLASDSVHYFLKEWTGNDAWQATLPHLLSEFTDLLRQALELMQMLEGADTHHDYSYIHHPSISAHPQNNDFRDWTALINLTRDAWLACLDRDSERAWTEALRWSLIPYPLFRRLLFFAGATAPAMFSHAWLLDHLLAEGGWWIWSVEARREAMQLLCALVPRMSADELERVQQVIIGGPADGMYRDDIEPDRQRYFIEDETYRLLNKIRNCGGELARAGLDRWTELGTAHPDWPTDDDERREFPTWSSPAGEWRTVEKAPRTRRELEAWLTNPAPDGLFVGDDWSERCRDDFPQALTALVALARRGEWNIPRWRDALGVWWLGSFLRWSWQLLAELLAGAPDEVFEPLKQQISMWVRENGKVFLGHDDAFFRILDRIVTSYGPDPIPASDDVIMSAINHPVGHVTDAALGWWYRQNLADDQGLRPEIEPLLTRLTNPAVEVYRHGRVILSTNIITLFRVDRTWTERQMLRFYRWDEWPAEAAIAWTAFLWSPRLHEPLFVVFKTDFLATARHYHELQKSDRQYANLLTYAALELSGTFTWVELAAATRALPENGLSQASQTLYQALQGAADRRAEYWTNRILPYLKRVWPKTLDIRTPKIVENFAILCVAAGELFPQAKAELANWLVAIPRPQFAVHMLFEAGLCGRFPVAALEFLGILVTDDAEWPPSELGRCLDAIEAAQASLAMDPVFQRLRFYIERNR